MRTVGLFEAKTHLASLVDQVKVEGTIVLTRRGKPVAELRPVESKGPRKFGAARDLINDVAPDFNAPLDDFEDYQ